MKRKTCLLILLVIFFIFNSKAQQAYIKCEQKTLLIKKFVADSMFSYNNKYVKYNAVKSIKESKFPVEIRIYSTGMYNNMFGFVMLQATEDSIFITNKRIWISGKLGVPRYEIVQRGDGYTYRQCCNKKNKKK